jgi:SEC-C motif-containing protein
MSRCRCHSGRTYKRCCQPAHAGRSALTPEALMRSRYCAYAHGLVDYVVDTTDPEGPQHRADLDAWRAEIEAFCRATRFRGLDVLESSADGDEGFVSFHAHLSRGELDTSFGERSRFVRRDGRWLYHSGHPFPMEDP